MPKNRPPKSGYARLAQTEEEDEYDSGHEDAYTTQGTISSPNAQYAPIQPSRRQDRMGTGPHSPSSERRPRHLRMRSNSGVDIKAINARLERWADEIASKFKRKGKKSWTDEQPEIQYTVFTAPEGVTPVKEANPWGYEPKMLQDEYDAIVESVRIAIEQGVQPKLISQGSSGSYFARNSEGKTVAVFKPKDEEPYASRNPKWTKWIHRNLFPFFFGRACLIPNLSYISEAAAYVLDMRLQTGIVPYTDVVSFSSPSFYYDFWDRRAFYRKKKALPEKDGSFQVFLKGFKDATLFLKEHPWPDQNNSMLRDGNVQRKKRRRRWTEDCRPGGPRDSDDEDDNSDSGTPLAGEENRRREFWSPKLRQSLQEQLERLVILDYIMRNTDRGLDNWMIRIDRAKEEAKLVAEPPKENGSASRQKSPDGNGHVKGTEDEQYKRREMMSAISRTGTPLAEDDEDASVSVGAIDNSLSWPWKHPDAWRSYPFGWLFLPASLIGQPFSQRTRDHFLPLLTSKIWWAETQRQLRRCFMRDSDFQERMYVKQLAVMKGQAWNVVETLKTEGHGPLELTRRQRVFVWDDIVEVPTVVPMERPSVEVRRKQRQQREEMDISAAGASAPANPAVQDLLGPSTPKIEPSTSPFNVSRQSSSMDINRQHRRQPSEAEDGALSPENLESFSTHASPERRNKARKPANPSHTQSYFTPKRPAITTHRSRMSFETPRNNYQADPSGPYSAGGHGRHHRRRFSLGGRREALWDEDEADLGFQAAEDRECNRRMVIVERLETVKGKNPFFTWC